jgi:hypothetical protein
MDREPSPKNTAGRRRRLYFGHHRVDFSVERDTAGRSGDRMADDPPGRAEGQGDADGTGAAALRPISRPRRVPF